MSSSGQGLQGVGLLVVGLARILRFKISGFWAISDVEL